MISGFSCEALADLEDGKLKVFVSNYPLAYFAERIGGHRVAVSLPVPAGEDPAFWRPDPEAISRMQKADLIALNGADYEKWLNRVSLPRLKQVDTSAGFKAAYIRIENAVTHSHGPGGEHSHDGIAFTTWLDLAQAGKQAEALALGVIRKRPELKAVFLENLSGLQADLKVLDDELLKLGEAKKNQPLLGSHPVYQYLARRYGLNLKSVHWEPNEMPPAAEWVALDETLIRHPARTMIWEAQPSPEIAARLKEKGVSSAVLDPCAQRPEQGDFLSVMQANIANLESTP
ncbi:zinc ABC transporter substrate-binding protein [Methylococcus sp. EFPC2]|nr:zinc ABC transporter substrate-binding protein [Methylococcus sp. EFPC2]